MKCPSCRQENKEKAKNCKKCGREISLPPAWFPDIYWHLKTLGIIYASLVFFYYTVSFLLRKLPKPYDIRQIPVAVTPWLRSGPKYLEEDALRPPEEAPIKAPPVSPLTVPRP